MVGGDEVFAPEENAPARVAAGSALPLGTGPLAYRPVRKPPQRGRQPERLRVVDFDSVVGRD